jgi:ribosomal-protein-alanine N-acetyltransferase
VTDAVTVRPATADDCEVLAGWLSEVRINRWLGSQWRDGNVDPRRVAFAINNKGNHFFVASSGNEPHGLVALSDLDRGDGVGMIWYLLGDQPLGGRGIMTRAVEQVVDRAFTELGLQSLYAWIHPANAASLRVLEKAGFRPAGRLRNAAVIDGARVDRVLFDLTLADWRARSQ